jgi:hypothetical protein
VAGILKADVSVRALDQISNPGAWKVIGRDAGPPYFQKMSDRETWTAKLRKLNPNVSKAKGDGKARFDPHKPRSTRLLVSPQERSGNSGIG